MLSHPSLRSIQAGHVDLHWVDLTDEGWDQRLSGLQQILSSDEIHRAYNFKKWGNSRNYIICRGVLRQLISDYTGIPASHHKLNYTPFGKPYISLESINLNFNISHSDEVALFAFCRASVGVDIERILPERELSKAAHMFLSDIEMQQMSVVPRSQVEMVCLRIWTRKEALLKAIGSGLTNALGEIVVGGSEGTIVLPSTSLMQEDDEWVIYEMLHLPNSIASVALPIRAEGGWIRNCFKIDSQQSEVSR